MQCAANAVGLKAIKSADTSSFRASYQMILQYRKSLCDIPDTARIIMKMIFFHSRFIGKSGLGGLLMAWRFCI